MLKEKFKQWLENEYTYGKSNMPLKSGSVSAYVSGIKSLGVKLGIKEEGLYCIADIQELKRLHSRVIDHPKATKDEKSHFEAYLKFIANES